ncbi:MAG: hypothetical protein E6069_10910 [Clostridium perfringens]|uniref:hypothetical protein n=1 Tax=Clostridium sp. TaxID=1506 RepID=UPI00290D93F2|nr:hypothetical protein [Clostridium sp.]MDU5545054.1 hypothetical protein [Clostridium perfringens]MDU5695364.1 hypothetical protein [Clostridium sp.]
MAILKVEELLNIYKKIVEKFSTADKYIAKGIQVLAVKRFKVREFLAEIIGEERVIKVLEELENITLIKASTSTVCREYYFSYLINLEPYNYVVR